MINNQKGLIVSKLHQMTWVLHHMMSHTTQQSVFAAFNEQPNLVWLESLVQLQQNHKIV